VVAAVEQELPPLYAGTSTARDAMARAAPVINDLLRTR
jgi:hypothetical protein